MAWRNKRWMAEKGKQCFNEGRPSIRLTKAPNTKHQTPNTKLQRNSKHQTPTTFDARSLAYLITPRKHIALALGIWSFFGVWSLGFGISDRPNSLVQSLRT